MDYYQENGLDHGLEKKGSFVKTSVKQTKIGNMTMPILAEFSKRYLHFITRLHCNACKIKLF